MRTIVQADARVVGRDKQLAGVAWQELQPGDLAAPRRALAPPILHICAGASHSIGNVTAA